MTNISKTLREELWLVHPPLPLSLSVHSVLKLYTYKIILEEHSEHSHPTCVPAPPCRYSTDPSVNHCFKAASLLWARREAPPVQLPAPTGQDGDDPVHQYSSLIRLMIGSQRSKAEPWPTLRDRQSRPSRGFLETPVWRGQNLLTFQLPKKTPTKSKACAFFRDLLIGQTWEDFQRKQKQEHPWCKFMQNKIQFLSPKCGKQSCSMTGQITGKTLFPPQAAYS